MDVIDLEDEEIDAEVLNSMAVTQVCRKSRRDEGSRVSDAGSARAMRGP